MYIRIEELIHKNGTRGGGWSVSSNSPQMAVEN